MIKFLAYIFCIPFGIFLDWGFFGRISLLIIVSKNLIGPVSTQSVDYKAYIFPRILATALGSLAICYDAFHQEGDRRYLWIGVTLFLLSLLYGIFATYWSTKHDRP